MRIPDKSVVEKVEDALLQCLHLLTMQWKNWSSGKPHDFCKAIQRTVPLILFLTIPWAAIAQNDPPKNQLEVIIDGQALTVYEGDTIDVGGKQVIIKTSGAKQFRINRLYFDYPKDYAYKYESETTFRNWTLDGNDFVIMIFEFPVHIELDMFTKEMVKKFGKKNCKVGPRKLNLKNVELAGHRINVKLLGSRITFDIYEVPGNDSRMQVIAFQDTKTDSGEDSAEGILTMKMVSESLRVE